MKFHTPVLLREAIELLNIEKNKKYIDATVGGGGHSEAVLKAGGKILGIDWDPEAVEFSKRHLELNCPNAFWKVVRGNFINLKEIAEREGFGKVDGILFDLGVSSHQLKSLKHGLSFETDAPLDMRINSVSTVTAADLLEVLSKKQLHALFTKFAQEKRAWAIADAIVRARKIKPIKTTRELSRLVMDVYGGRRRQRLHPATKVFLALRIVVNSELENLKTVLPQAVSLLNSNGRLLAISFHELEDRIVKNFFKEMEKTGELKILTKKPITPGEKEVMVNPRSRSAKLRAAIKI